MNIPETGAKLVGIPDHHGAEPDDETCVVDGRRRYTSRQVRNEIARYITEFRQGGLTTGDRVLALLDHDPRAAFFLAAASAFGLRLLMPYGLRTASLPEWLSIAENARPDAAVHVKRDRSGVHELRQQGLPVLEIPDTVEEIPDRDIVIDHPEPIDEFLVLFSSGTTGKPKAISIREDLITTKIASVTKHALFSRDSRIFMSGLMNNTTGVIFTFGGLLHGATVLFPDDLDPATWPAQVAAQGATHIQLRPAALRQFVAAARSSEVDLSCLRVLGYGGGSVSHALIDEGRELIPAHWIQGYGLSETYGPFCWLDETAHRQQRHRDNIYCLGRPDETVDVRIDPVEGHPAGVGEVLVRGAVMEGYLDVTTGNVESPGEWFRTGDLGEWSTDGDLVLKGRLSSSLLTSNGHRIYPEETEATLATVPGAEEVLLVGAATNSVDERPVVCLSGPIGTQEQDVIRARVVEVLTRTLSSEKWPDFAYVTSNRFPRNANGKTVRHEVAKLVEHDKLLTIR